MAVKITCLLVLAFGFAQASVLPVEQCKLADKKCLVSSVQKMIPVFIKGMPEYGVEVLDPMKLNLLKFDLAGLQFTLSDGILKGWKSTVVDSVSWDTSKKMFTIDLYADINIKGSYTAAGRVLILPITGDGAFKLKMKHLNIKLNYFYDLVKIDGKDHVKLNKNTFKYEVVDGATYQLDNLFNGNKELSTAMLTFLNENWKEIATEFGTPLMDLVAKQLYTNINHLFEKLPLADIASV